MPKLKTDLSINLDELEFTDNAWTLNPGLSEDIKNALKVTSADKKFFKDCQALAPILKKQKSKDAKLK